MTIAEADLAGLVDIIRGISFPTEAKRTAPGPGLVACLRTSNVQAAVEWDDLLYVDAQHVKSKEQFVRPGDILVSMSNSLELVGKCAIVTDVPVDAAFGAFIAVVRVRPGVDPRYVFHAMRSPAFKAYLRSVASTTTNISNINSSKLMAGRVPLFGERSSQLIVSRIDELFSRIDEGERALGRVSMLVERYRKSVLKAAVAGELTGQWRKKNRGVLESGEALLGRVLIARRDAWEAAELKELKAKGITPENDKWKRKYQEPPRPDKTDRPELPEGWTWASLGQLIKKLDQGWSPQCTSAPATQDGRDWGVIKTTAVQAMRYEGTANKALPSSLDPRPNLEIEPGDLLVTRAGPRSRVGIACLVRSTRPRLMICDKVYRLRLLDQLISRDYVEIALNSPPLLEELEKLKSGINDSGLNLTQERFLALTIPLPSFAEQTRIADAVAKALSEADGAAKHARVSGEPLRQGVLRLAFSGKWIEQSGGDEPASQFLAGIAVKHTTNAAAPKRGRKKKITA